MNEEEKKALKVINARIRRLLDELEIEKEDMSDEPRIAYLMQEIRANKTILNLIEKLQKENESWKSYSEELEEEQIEKNNKNCELEFEVEELQKENNKLREYTKTNENELTFDVDCDWDALQKALDEAEKSNEYIIYDNEKWIKEKYCVPIQEIKDIIEELEEKMFCEHNVRVLVQLYKQKQILLELLERRK